MIIVKRIYDPVGAQDGVRYFVERLWPRGIKSEALPKENWLKDVSPSAELRQWFNHDPEKWDEFQRRYLQELNGRPDDLKPLLEQARRGNVTLLYSARDTQHNSALLLKDFLDQQLQSVKD